MCVHVCVCVCRRGRDPVVIMTYGLDSSFLLGKEDRQWNAVVFFFFSGEGREAVIGGVHKMEQEQLKAKQGTQGSRIM